MRLVGFNATSADAEGLYSPLIDLEAFFRKTSGQRAVVRVNIFDFSTSSAGKMLVTADVSIVAFLACSETQLDNFTLFFQDPKISVNGGLPDLGVGLPDTGEDFLRSRMGSHVGEGIENYLPLAAFSKRRAHLKSFINNENDY